VLHAVIPISGLAQFVSEQLWLYAVFKFTPDHMEVQWDPANILLNPPLSPSQHAGAQPRSRSQSPVFAPTAPLPPHAFFHPNPHERPQYSNRSCSNKHTHMVKASGRRTDGEEETWPSYSAFQPYPLRSRPHILLMAIGRFRV
jgi:hypothetical protein